MVQFTVERSQKIQAPREEVWENIITFKKQQQWFPWYIGDANASRKISGNDGEIGASESWDGQIIGSGTRSNTNILIHEFLDQSIEWKNRVVSQGRMYFSLQKCGSDCTLILWGVQAELPWYRWYMKKSLCAQVASDLETGLELFGDFITKNPLPKITENASKTCEEVFTLGIERSSTQNDISNVMSEDFKTLWDYVIQNKIPSHGARAYYMDVNLKKDSFTYRPSIILSPDAFMELDDASLPEGMKKYYYPAGNIYSIRLTGSYSYLGFAWSVLYRFLFHKKIKYIKKYPSYEDYVNDPSKTPDHKRMTDICCYVK